VVLIPEQREPAVLF